MSEPDGYVMMVTRVSIPRSCADIECTWRGGNVARLHRGNAGLLDFDPHGMLSNHAPEVGDVFDYGGYTVRCIESTARYVDVVRV